MLNLGTTALSLLVLATRCRSAYQTPLRIEPLSTNPQSTVSNASSSSLHIQDVSAIAETIISTLSASSQHTTFLHLLQRAKAVPMLAHIGSGTVFAPTGAAWEAWAESKHPESWLGDQALEEWLLPEDEVLRMRIARSGDADSEKRILDNQNWALRQHLLYHMLNYTLPPSSLFYSPDSEVGTSPNISTETTLLFPRLSEPALPPTPPPGPPWLPRGEEGLLGGHGQRLRIARGGTDMGGERGKVAVDHNGEGGWSIWDGEGWKDEERNSTNHVLGKEGVVGARWVRNGVVVGIDGVIDMPPSIEEVIKSHPSLSYLSSLLASSLPSPLPNSLSSTPHLTIFAPSNEAFQFDELERRYLESEFGSEGVGRVVGSGVVLGVGKNDQVGWRDTWGKKGYQESASGEELMVETDTDGGMTVNGTSAEVVDIFASNGVVHIVPTLLLPQNFTLLNSAEKVLLSLNATQFVSLLRATNLSTTYVGEPGKDQNSEAWTILAPTDDVLDTMARWGGYGSPALPQFLAEPLITDLTIPRPPTSNPIGDASPLASLLMYHIIPGRLLPSEIKDGMLFGTELKTAALAGGRQRVRVDVSERLGKDRVDWDVEEGEIRFGGATVLGSPVKSGRSIIYVISSLLSPPVDVLQTAVSDLQLSTFIAAVYATDSDRFVKRTPGVTYFMPRNRAFAQLGLTMKYLLLAEGKDDLRKVIKYHAVDSVVYTSDIEKGKTTLKTLEGGEIVLNKVGGKHSSGNLTVRSPNRWKGYDSGEDLPSNGDLRSGMVTNFDTLTSTGVIHTIDSVIMPSDVKITIGKLVRGAKVLTTMSELMIKAGLGWVLEGREPNPEEVQRVELEGVIKTSAEIGDSPNEEDGGPNLDGLAMPSYTLLCPTDDAFAKINITDYKSDQQSLLNLVKLHIIPSTRNSSNLPKLSGKKPMSPPKDGHPLSIDDDVVYPTLLSSTSKYGSIAFRATGDNSFLVGIKNARSGSTGNSARVGVSGRASVRWKPRREEISPIKILENLKEDEKRSFDDDQLWINGMTLGGGVILIDSVLIPYEPSWWTLWGPTVLISGGASLVLIGLAVWGGWWWMSRKDRAARYEPLEGEEEE